MMRIWPILLVSLITANCLVTKNSALPVKGFPEPAEKPIKIFLNSPTDRSLERELLIETGSFEIVRTPGLKDTYQVRAWWKNGDISAGRFLRMFLSAMTLYVIPLYATEPTTLVVTISDPSKNEEPEYWEESAEINVWFWLPLMPAGLSDQRNVFLQRDIVRKELVGRLARHLQEKARRKSASQKKS